MIPNVHLVEVVLSQDVLVSGNVFIQSVPTPGLRAASAGIGMNATPLVLLASAAAESHSVLAQSQSY